MTEAGKTQVPALATPAEWDALIADWDGIRHGYYYGSDAPGTVLPRRTSKRPPDWRLQPVERR
ncbi:hypothetical protein [Streptomyces sp. V3I7]|uniref:hypothetical protein n=1 Tax=Streptomyces sp. V3I7 TaxID=3042278 RepID=UPI00277D7B63|nr:hypothetical protein [Streptomyces sp. V3I7]MDQ0990800.1 hypothetical protein [Streptomyces sp. V3I7]